MERPPVEELDDRSPKRQRTEFISSPPKYIKPDPYTWYKSIGRLTKYNL